MESAPGVVVAHVPDPRDHASEHERATLLGFAHRVAALKGWAMGGMYEPSRDYGAPLYFVPCSTLTAEQAAELGVCGAEDLFGGVVPHAFVATKAISHPLVAAGARAIAGWDPRLAQQLGDAVLAGFTAFSLEDARHAARQLLAQGPVRVKPVRASGGRGQSVARTAAEMDAVLAGLDDAEVLAHGVVLEEDLAEIRTFSIGQVQVGGFTATYHGCQRLTRNNAGHEVFGGSDLSCVRGGFDELLQLPMPPEVAHAVAQARRYDAAVRACYPGFYASRSNYDVLLGRDAAGRTRSAVLEQSWRVGGATGPELAALEAFRREPRRSRARARCFEVFGPSPEPPAHATVYFRGADPRVGELTKYTVLEPDVDPR
jgi:hypothetical protein